MVQEELHTSVCTTSLSFVVAMHCLSGLSYCLIILGYPVAAVQRGCLCTFLLISDLPTLAATLLKY